MPEPHIRWAALLTRTLKPASERPGLFEIGHAFLSCHRGCYACRSNQWARFAMNELDFSGRQVLVIGGSSGIGNGIAQAFRARGARVAVCGTRASAADYATEQGSQLEGLHYAQLDVSNAAAIEGFQPSFDQLDVLVLAQGAVIYRRGEFEMAGFRKVLEVNLTSLMRHAVSFDAVLERRLADHRELHGGLPLDQRQSRL
jgi:NAD(P)-dependent dehydrogenase (short-subunit alcohol dehydrogenase family)